MDTISSYCAFLFKIILSDYNLLWLSTLKSCICFTSLQSKLCKIVKNSDKNQISNIIKDERPLIKEFVLGAKDRGDGQDTALPVRVASVICKYLEEKLV